VLPMSQERSVTHVSGPDKRGMVDEMGFEQKDLTKKQ
jgi:hypothetical protein